MKVSAWKWTVWTSTSCPIPSRYQFTLSPWYMVSPGKVAYSLPLIAVQGITQGKRLSVKLNGCCTSAEEGSKLEATKLIQHPMYQQLVAPTGQSPQLSYLSTLLTARTSELHSRPCYSSNKSKNYLCWKPAVSQQKWLLLEVKMHKNSIFSPVMEKHVCTYIHINEMPDDHWKGVNPASGLPCGAVPQAGHIHYIPTTCKSLHDRIYLSSSTAGRNPAVTAHAGKESKHKWADCYGTHMETFVLRWQQRE